MHKEAVTSFTALLKASAGLISTRFQVKTLTIVLDLKFLNLAFAIKTTCIKSKEIIENNAGRRVDELLF